MSQQKELKICLDEVLEDRAKEILTALGLSLSEAVSMFMAQVLLRGGLPFEAALPEPDDQELMDRVYESLHSGSGSVVTDDNQLSLDDDLDVPWDEDDPEDDCCAI